MFRVSDLAPFNCVTDDRRKVVNVVVVNCVIYPRRKLPKVIALASGACSGACFAAAGVAATGVAAARVAAVKLFSEFDLVSFRAGVRSLAPQFVSDLELLRENGIHEPRIRDLESRITRAMITSMMASMWFRP